MKSSAEKQDPPFELNAEKQQITFEAGKEGHKFDFSDRAHNILKNITRLEQKLEDATKYGRESVENELKEARKFLREELLRLKPETVDIQLGIAYANVALEQKKTNRPSVVPTETHRPFQVIEGRSGEKSEEKLKEKESPLKTTDRYIFLFKALDKAPEEQRQLFVGKLAEKNKRLTQEQSTLGVVAGMIEDDLAKLDERLQLSFVNAMRDSKETPGILHQLEDADGDEDALQAIEKDGRIKELKERFEMSRENADPAVVHRIDAVNAFLDYISTPSDSELPTENKSYAKKAA